MTQLNSFESGADAPDEQPASRGKKRFHQMRSNARVSCHIDAHAIQDGFEIPCVVSDISMGGAQVTFDTLSAQSVHDKPIILDIPEIGRLPAVFRWRAGPRGGVQFSQSDQNKTLLRKKLEDLL